MKIALGTLKDQGEELATFLEPRVGGKPSVSGDSIEFEDDGVKQGVKPRHVKTYVKRFLYMKGVRKNYRVFVAGKELTIQEIELGEEEEKKEEKKPAKEEAPKKEEPEEAEPEAEAAEGEKEEEKAEKPKKSAPKKPRTKAKKKAEEDA